MAPSCLLDNVRSCHTVGVRLYTGGGAQAASGAMAADPGLQISRVSGALKACYVLIFQPEALPEMRFLQVSHCVHSCGCLSWLSC